jgi:hypothetical protein
VVAACSLMSSVARWIARRANSRSMSATNSMLPVTLRMERMTMNDIKVNRVVMEGMVLTKGRTGADRLMNSLNCILNRRLVGMISMATPAVTGCHSGIRNRHEKKHTHDGRR